VLNGSQANLVRADFGPSPKKESPKKESPKKESPKKEPI
jgi:hypothetical protein